MKDSKISVSNLALRYGETETLRNISLDIRQNRVTAIIGPSGCGKSSFLRVLNRMNDLIEHAAISGNVLIDGENIYDPDVDIVALRKKVGMVFQRPNLFPKTILENIAFGLKINGVKDKDTIRERVQKACEAADIWDEIKTRLDKPALSLSEGQQQRLCIARALAVDPEILLMDEPVTGLDPISTAQIEELIRRLRDDHTIVIATHNLQQAGRVSDYTAFLLDGALIEYNKTTTFFTNPENQQTEDYITGRFG